MKLLLILAIVLLLVVALFILAYFFKPEILTLPYTLFLSIFVSNPPFVNKDKYFPESRKLEENWKKIREELVDVLKHDENIPHFHEIDNIQRFISARDEISWRTYGIKAFDNWISPNAEMVPITTSILKEMPDVTLAMFSILDPGKHIPKHFGFFKGVFRYHLALIVPDAGECYITCGGERYDWKEGEGVLFDDTYWHEVWNKTKQRRVVLFLDVFRSESLPKWLRPLNRKMTRLLANSKRIKNAAKQAEVVVEK